MPPSRATVLSAVSRAACLRRGRLTGRLLLLRGPPPHSQILPVEETRKKLPDMELPGEVGDKRDRERAHCGGAARSPMLGRWLHSMHFDVT